MKYYVWGDDGDNGEQVSGLVDSKALIKLVSRHPWQCKVAVIAIVVYIEKVRARKR